MSLQMATNYRYIKRSEVCFHYGYNSIAHDRHNLIPDHLVCSYFVEVNQVVFRKVSPINSSALLVDNAC